MEVVVTFVQGDVDRPLVLGTVYNAAAPFPFPLPSSATQSGWRTRSTPGGNGGNELQFEDAAGSERIYVHAQRDLEEEVLHDHHSDVTHDRTLRVGGDRYVAVSGNSIQTVEKSHAVTIQGDMILHVVGRHIVQCDGASSSADEDDEEAAGTKDQEAAAEAEAAPGPAAARDDGTASTELTRARLLWAAERMPDDQYEAARAQVEAIEALAAELASLCSKALEVLAPEGEPARAATSAAIAAFGDRVAAAALDAMSTRSTTHPAMTSSAIDALRALHSDSVRARAALAGDAKGESHLRGVIRGGGGFPQIPKPPTPPRSKDSHVVKMVGGYTMDSPDGLTLKGQGATLTMKGNKLEGKGDEIVFEAGSSITLKVGGSTIEMKGESINISTSGVIKLWAGMILLN